jgi:hypothetical protein
MPYADYEKAKIKSREYNKRWYEKNKQRHIASVEKNRSRYHAAWSQFKASLSCTHCGFSHPAALDFHHVVRDGTKQSVNALVGARRFAAAYEEIKKCIPLCANCHRIHHYDETQNERKARQARRKKNKKENSP